MKKDENIKKDDTKCECVFRLVSSLNGNYKYCYKCGYTILLMKAF